MSGNIKSKTVINHKTNNNIKSTMMVYRLNSSNKCQNCSFKKIILKLLNWFQFVNFYHVM